MKEWYKAASEARDKAKAEEEKASKLMEAEAL